MTDIDELIAKFSPKKRAELLVLRGIQLELSKLNETIERTNNTLNATLSEIARSITRIGR